MINTFCVIGLYVIVAICAIITIKGISKRRRKKFEELQKTFDNSNKLRKMYNERERLSSINTNSSKRKIDDDVTTSSLFTSSPSNWDFGSSDIGSSDSGSSFDSGSVDFGGGDFGGGGAGGDW